MAHESHKTIWLEVANVRLFNNDAQIQVKGDRNEPEPIWWHVNLNAYSDFKNPLKAYQALSEGLDKKRSVIAGLGFTSNGKELECQLIRIQYAESATR